MVAANLLTKTATELFNAGQKADKYIQIAKSESGKSRFQIQINVPTFNRINIGKKVVREPMPIGATLKQAIKRRDALRNEAYGGFKKIDQQTLTKLLKTDKYKNLTGYKAIANQLHKDKYISRANQLFKTTSADKALALLGNFKLDAKFKTVGNPTRTISEVYDALKTTPQGSVLIKLHKEGKITDTSIRDKVTDLLRAKRRVEMPTITGGKSPKISYKGARNVSPEYKLWLDVIESTGRKKSFSGTPRFEIVKSGKGFTDYIIKDNLASYRGGRFGGQKFSLNGTEPGTVSFKEFVENSKSALPGFEKTELGKGTYSRMLSPYVLGKELNKTKLVYEGKPITLGQFLNSRVYMDSDEYAKHIGRDNWFHEGFEVEHIAGIGNSPYLTNLSTRFSNNQIESLLSLADTHYAKTGDAKQAFNIVADASKEMNLAGLKRNIKFGDKIMKFNHENKLSSLFNSLTDQLNYPFLGTSKEGVVTDPLKQALRRAVQNPVVKEQRKILKINKGGRVGVGEGGRIGKQVGGVTPKATGTLGGGGGTGNIGGGPTNKIGTIQSMLAGIGAGIIDIPRGAFTLGAALLDLGLGTNKAAKVEQWFDDLTEFDETAEQSTLAGLVRTLTNLGIPGAAAWKMGTQVTKKALLAKRNGNYFRITDPKLEERMKTALNAKGRIAATLGGAAAAGVSDAIFVGDPETVGTMGDLFGGGPTQLEPNSSTEASREVMNRIKFGLDGALFLGVIGGTGSSIKSAIARRNDLSSTNSTLDAFLSKLRPRGAKPQEFFDLERRNIGLRAGDVNYAGEVARKLDKHIDAIFPFVKNPFNKMGNKGRSEFMDELNETLLSGRIEMDVTGKSAFGAMDPDRVAKITKMMKDRGAKQADVDGVLDSFEQMRLGWAHMFSRLGYSMKDADPKVLEEFKGIIGDKFKSYLGSTYEIFGNRSLIPLLNYAPTEEAVNKAVKMVQDSARTAGKTLNDEEARHFVDKMVESARLPRGLATTKEKTSGIYLEVPEFFANKTVLSELEFNPKIALDSLNPDARKVIDEVLGKVSDPMQTMLAGSGRLSLITRRNQFYEELMKKSTDDIAAGEKGFFYETELDAFNALGGNIKKIEIDPSRTIEAGITNPLNGKYAEKGVADAIEESAMLARDKGNIRQMYDSLILYPKATSQIAKTILSPITHVRNFVSAGAFAGANGLLPGLVSPDDMAAAFKSAYKSLQIPGARMANDEYRELLRLGVVNSNVRLGDLQRLLQDVNFGETLTAQKGLRGLMRPLSKAKKWTEEMYTAEDDFWKISSYALERQRLGRAYETYGIKVTDDLLNEEAASIVRNNIPNYDMVNDFIKGLRQLPFGNFVSFPAEIMRTSTNILGRALKEINYQHTLDDGRVVNPLRNIGYKRLFGFGTTVVGVPYGTVEAAKAIYDVSEDEMKAMRRFVPGWSQNSTLVPIRDTETGELKYVDFSHANAYDTMIRPINTMINSVNKGIDEGEIMKEVALGMFNATKETVSPFISESIWFEGASDIFLRGGRTREGRRLWTEATPWGEKVSITVGHLVKTQMPGSIPALNRMGLSIREEVDEYGRSYELGDELAGIFGFRAVKVDPLRSMKFKIADFRTGINAARREFTKPLLRGGVVNPADVVDRFEVANEAAYKAQQDMFKDYYGALTLGAGVNQLDLQFADRMSNVQLNAIKSGKFKPFIPSDNIKKAFADNARAIGAPNGYLAAERQIQSMINKYNNLPLFGGLAFPRTENPFIGNTVPQAAVQGISPVSAVSGMQGITPGGVVNNQNLTALKGQRVFGSTDPIFGVG